MLSTKLPLCPIFYPLKVEAVTRKTQKTRTISKNTYKKKHIMTIAEKEFYYKLKPHQPDRLDRDEKVNEICKKDQIKLITLKTNQPNEYSYIKASIQKELEPPTNTTSTQ